MSKDVIIPLTIDDSDMIAKVAAQQTAIDAQAADWRAKRNQILLEMHSMNLGIGLMIRSIRTAVLVTGQALDPVQSALLSLVSSTASIIIATSTALAVGSLGLLTGPALVLMAIAFAFQTAQTGRIIGESEALRAAFDDINSRLRNLETSHQTMRGMPF